MLASANNFDSGFQKTTPLMTFSVAFDTTEIIEENKIVANGFEM